MIGTQINNRYLVQTELGRGGMGVVYRAHDTLLERDVAVKVLWSGALGSQGRARLLREAQAAARLNHQNIINIYDAGDIDGLSYIVMELLDGDSLFDRKPETLESALQVLRQICDALEHAHLNGIIHRDLKPENVIVTSQGIAKLTDFGLSRSLTSRISQEGIIVGTVYYLAPEQALRQDIDSRADLYALGVLMYELTTGRLPFTADDPLGVISQHLNAPVVPPSTYNSAIPPALDGLILRLMSKRPEDRPATAAEVRSALDHLYDEPEALTLNLLTSLSPLDRLTRGRLVGRQAEFERIKTQWQEVLAAQASENFVVISGEAGIGKTPLIKEIRSLAQISGGRPFYSECYAQGSAPYSSIIQILRDARPLPEGLPELVQADLYGLSRDLAPHSEPSQAPLSPISEQQRIFESLFAVFATLAERQPLALILEDAHWADENSLYFLRHLARRSRPARLKLMIVLTYRPEDLGNNAALKDVLLDLNQERLAITIGLLPFTREQTRNLLATMFMEEISDRFLDAIYRVTEGNLFFIEEICKALIEEGKLYCDGGHWHLDEAETLELPQSVRVALQVRLNRLPEKAQELLRLAALIGREFDFETLRHASEQQNEDDLIEALEQAVRAQLINEIHASRNTSLPLSRQGGERFAFAHALIPATLRDEVSSLRRRRYHRRIANAIETVSPEDLEALAYHYGQAGDPEKARLYTMKAGDRARKLYANGEALRFYNEAFLLTPEDHPDRFHILAARAKVYDVLAQRDLERQDIEAMLELAEQRDDNPMRCDALIALADYYLVTENYLMREPAGRAVEIARTLNNPAQEGRALRNAGWSAWIHHDYHESLSALETAVARFRQAGMLPQAAECLHMLSLVTGLQGLGELEVSRKFAEDAVQLSRIARDPRQEAISLRRLAMVQMNQMETGVALHTARQALTLHRELGDRFEECMALNTIAVMLSFAGDHLAARASFDQSLAIAQAIGSNMGIAHAVGNLLWFYYRREGLYEAGLRFIEDQLARPEVQKDPSLLTGFLRDKADMLHQVGQYGAAIAALRQALELTDRSSGPVLRASVRLAIARLHAAMHQFGEAQFALDEARELSRKFERPNDVAQLCITEAEIARQEWETGNLKQIRRAAAQAEQAVTLLRGTPWRVDLAQALQTAAWVALALNQPEKALENAAEAQQIFQSEPVRPEGYQYVYVCALWANERSDEASVHLEQAYQRVMQVANRISSDELRKCWLEDVYLNQQIVNDWVNEHEVL